MKRSLFMHRLRNTCALAALLLPSAVLAQDNYWLLDGNKCFNTGSLSVISGAALVGPASNPHVRTVYDPTGHEIFSYGANDITYNTNVLSYGGGVQAFRIPGLCKQYYVLNVYSSPGPHVASVTLTKIDAGNSSTGPVAGPTNLVANLGPFNYSAVAGKLDAAGNRYIYCLTPTVPPPGFPSVSCDLISYKIAADGSFTSGSNYTVISTGVLPKCAEKTRIKMAPDQKSLAYTDVNGKLVTYNFVNNSFTAYDEVALGMFESNGSGTTRRWHVSTGSKLGYYTEGDNTLFTTISITDGIKSDISRGPLGVLFVATGDPATSTGTLKLFGPFSPTPVFTTLTGSPQIVGVNNIYTPTAYSFGNNVEGEDINQAQTTSASFTVNGLSGSNTAPGTIWVCPNMTTAALNVTVTGWHANNYTYCKQFGALVNGVFTPSGIAMCYSTLFGTVVPSATYNTSIPTGSSPTHMKVDVTVVDVCGNSLTSTQYYEIKPVSVLANYQHIGYSSGLTVGKPVQTTLPITTTPPAPSNNSTVFKANMTAATGYMGATSCGLININTNGSWAVKVYEVDDTSGVRKIRSGIPAPNIVDFTGAGSASNAMCNFGLNSWTFDYSKPPFYIDLADLSNGGYGDNYFNPFYSWSLTQGTLASDFANRVYCAEMIVTESASGCIVSNKSYFKIAVNGSYPNGSNAKPAPEEEESPLFPISIYPNPTSNIFTIAIPTGTINASIKLTDNTGRILLENEHLQIGRNSIDIRQFPLGIYLYSLSVDGKIQHGKLVKQ